MVGSGRCINPILGMDNFKKLQLSVSQKTFGRKITKNTNKKPTYGPEKILFMEKEIEDPVAHYTKKIEKQLFTSFLQKTMKSKILITMSILEKISK